MKAGSIFFFDEVEDHLKIDLTIYHQLIRNLIYLVCGIQSDIAFIIGQVSCDNSDL